jgi:hypothetical protein
MWQIYRARRKRCHRRFTRFYSCQARGGDASAVWAFAPVYFYFWFCVDAVRMDGVGALCGVSANDAFLDLNHSAGDVNLAFAARFCLL